MTVGGLADHDGQLLFGEGLAGQIAILIEGGAGAYPGSASSTPADAAGAKGGVAHPLVVVASRLLIAKAHGHGEVGVGVAGAADPLGPASQQAADAIVGFRVAQAGRGAVVGYGSPRVALLHGGALAQGAHGLGGLAKGVGMGGGGKQQQDSPAPGAESLHDGYLELVSGRYRPDMGGAPARGWNIWLCVRPSEMKTVWNFWQSKKGAPGECDGESGVCAVSPSARGTTQIDRFIISGAINCRSCTLTSCICMMLASLSIK
ncbi:hypothetical protein D3C76_919320 [compost metagenome]